jgi:hypothetical protein
LVLDPPQLQPAATENSAAIINTLDVCMCVSR